MLIPHIAVLLFASVSAEYVEFVVSPEITWGWEFIDSETIRFTMKCVVDGYCSIGLGNQKMYPNDMFAVIQEDGTATVGDYYSASYQSPDHDTERDGGEEHYELVEGSYADGILSATFDRALDTGDQWDHLIVDGEMIDYCWAWHKSDTTYNVKHQMDGSGTVTISSTAAGSGLKSVVSDSKDEFEEHGEIMSVMWFIVAHIGIITARYGKFTYWWFWIHIGGFSVVTWITIDEVFRAWDENEMSNMMYEDDNKIYHSRLGLAIGALIIGQATLGLLTRANIWLNKSNIYIVSTLRQAHQVLGYSLAILSSVQIYYGWDVFNDDYDDDRLYLAYTAYWILIALYGVLELNHQLSARFLINPFTECRSCCLPEMSHAEAMQKIAEGKKYVFYDDLVLDVGNFQWSHPGGSIMFEDTIGQDMGKYLHGSSSIGGNFNPYDHSFQALKLARQLAVAVLPKPDLGRYADSLATTDLRWKLAGKKEIAKGTINFTLKSDELNIPNMPAGVEWMGQHYAVSYGGVTRYYSFSQSIRAEYADGNYASENLSDTKEDALLLKTKAGLEDEAFLNERPTEGSTNLVQLYIRCYPKGKLTQKLLNAPLGANIRLKGPMGPGLMLTPETRGHCAAFAGGTGLIPFMDLVELLYWRKVNPDLHGNLLSGIKLSLWVGFQTKEDVFGKKLLDATQEAYGEDDTFQLKISISSEEGRIDQNAVAEMMNKETVLVWICGPSGFNEAVRAMARTTDATPEDIIML